MAHDDRPAEPPYVKCLYNAVYIFSLVAPNERYGFLLFVITVAFGRLHDDTKLKNLD